MARVVLVGNLAQLTGGVAEFELSATSVKQLFEQLTELHPALGPHLDEGIAVAIDGQIYQDTLLEPIRPDSEVYLLPQIAGGASAHHPDYSRVRGARGDRVLSSGGGVPSCYVTRSPESQPCGLRAGRGVHSA